MLRLVAVAAAILSVLATLLYAFLEAGQWLLVDDPLQPAQAIAVFGGEVPFRAMEAAALYGQHLAPEVWVTKGRHSEEDAALEELGIERPTEYMLSRDVLQRRGVPANAIRLLPESTENTAVEVQVIARKLRATGGDTVILVTSKYHSRRVKALWHRLADAGLHATVRYAWDDPSDPAHWWATTSNAFPVFREWFGILNALAGFPIRTSDS
jgi:uncharacterized SAM-binding protein YcdF (DUF218 family)